VEHRAAVRETLGAVASLPDRQRRALLRSAVDGFSPAAIAVELGVSEGAVRQLVHRARVSVRAAVGAVLPAPVAWLARRVGAGAARVAPTSPAAAPLAPKLAVVVVAAISTAVPLAAIVHQASGHQLRPVLARAFHPVHSAPIRATVRPEPRTAGGGAGRGAGSARAAAPAGPSFTVSSRTHPLKPHKRKAPPAGPAPVPMATQASADQTPSDPGTTPSCDPTDPSCGGTTSTNPGCDPSTDPTCGGTTGGNTGCDPSTDPSCGGTTGGGTTGGNSGCDPTTDPACGATTGGGTTGGNQGCDPTTDPTCGGSTSADSVGAGSSSDSSGGSPSAAAGSG
jgi:hypothetical protein